MHFNAANGSTITARRMCKLNLKIGNVSQDMWFRVLENLSSPVLIGMDVFEEFGIIANGQDQTIKLKSGDVILYFSKYSEKGSAYIVSILESLSVPPSSMKQVQMYLNCNFNGIVYMETPVVQTNVYY